VVLAAVCVFAIAIVIFDILIIPRGYLKQCCEPSVFKHCD
jgi:hypothetical protein